MDSVNLDGIKYVVFADYGYDGASISENICG